MIEKYVNYRDSGIRWLDSVPKHWNAIPLKRIANLTTGMTPPTSDVGNYSEDEPFGWVRPEDIDESGNPTRASKFLSAKGWAIARHIPANSSLICCIGTIGKVGYTAELLSTNQQITAATFSQCSRFFTSRCLLLETKWN